MNRSDRRRLAKEGKIVNDKTYHLKDSDIHRIKDEATHTATNIAFLLMLSIPNMIIHDKWDELVEAKSKGGSACEELFAAHVIELFDTLEKGYITLPELAQCLYDETGVRIEGFKVNEKKLE